MGYQKIAYWASLLDYEFDPTPGILSPSTASIAAGINCGPCRTHITLYACLGIPSLSSVAPMFPLRLSCCLQVWGGNNQLPSSLVGASSLEAASSLTSASVTTAFSSTTFSVLSSSATFASSFTASLTSFLGCSLGVGSKISAKLYLFSSSKSLGTTDKPTMF